MSQSVCSSFSHLPNYYLSSSASDGDCWSGRGWLQCQMKHHLPCNVQWWINTRPRGKTLHKMTGLSCQCSMLHITGIVETLTINLTQLARRFHPVTCLVMFAHRL